MKIFSLLAAFFISISWVAGQTLEDDRKALIRFYTAANGDQWNNQTAWSVPGKPKQNPCSWAGVSCTGTGNSQRVTGLKMIGNGLSGTIHEGILELTALKTLIISENPSLDATLPAGIEAIKLDTLNLSYDSAATTLSSGIGKITTLKYLDASGAKAPANFMTSLSGLVNLTNLLMVQSGLKGPLPKEVGRLTKLKQLILNDNAINGAIPAWIGSLTELELLSISNNGLTGAIPVQLSQLKKLTGLHIDRNKLTGTIPVALANMTSLRFLQLNANGLTGTIPVELGNMAALSGLILSKNKISGKLPESLGKLVATLSVLRLDSNSLSGGIPTVFGDLIGANLSMLNLTGNKLSGALSPSLFAKAKNTPKEIYLADNAFTGAVPLTINQLLGTNGGSVVDLSGNEFKGSFPVITKGIGALAVDGKPNQIDFSGNNYTFTTLEKIKLPVNISLTAYPQKLIKAGRVKEENVFYASAGGTLANNVYTWVRVYGENGKLKADTVAVIEGDSTYEINESDPPGAYYASVLNTKAVSIPDDSADANARMAATENQTLRSEYIDRILPVSLAEFSGKATPEGNILNWRTTQEVNSNGFEVQRSMDAKHFTSLGFVESQDGDSNEEQHYSFSDTDPGKLTYYRLKQIDRDGSFEFSDIISIRAEFVAAYFYPNPAPGGIIYASKALKEQVVTVVNIEGRVVYSQKPNNQGAIDVSKLKEGTYILKAGNTGQRVLIGGN